MLHEESEWGAEPGVFRPERHLKDVVLTPPSKIPYGTFGCVLLLRTLCSRSSSSASSFPLPSSRCRPSSRCDPSPIYHPTHQPTTPTQLRPPHLRRHRVRDGPDVAHRHLYPRLLRHRAGGGGAAYGRVYVGDADVSDDLSSILSVDLSSTLSVNEAGIEERQTADARPTASPSTSSAASSPGRPPSSSCCAMGWRLPRLVYC